jgi:hypothetical protein
MKSNFKDIFLVIVSLIGSQNGRYIIDDKNVLLDTRNGKMYFPNEKVKRVTGEPNYYWDLKYDEVK